MTDFMILYAFRHALMANTTIAPFDMATWLVDNWTNLSYRLRELIAQDLTRFFRNYLEERNRYPWQRLLSLCEDKGKDSDMTVRDLIDKLKLLDPDLTVLRDDDINDFAVVREVVVEETELADRVVVLK